MFGKLAAHLKYGIFVLTGLVVLVSLSKWTEKKSAPVTRAPAPPQQQQVQTVMNQAAAHNSASHSDHQDAVTSLVDVTTALASLNTAVALAGDAQVSGATGVATRTLEHEMVTHQRNLMRQLSEPVPAPHRGGQLPPLPKI